jgi:hypothetical protein
MSRTQLGRAFKRTERCNWASLAYWASHQRDVGRLDDEAFARADSHAIEISRSLRHACARD